MFLHSLLVINLLGLATCLVTMGAQASPLDTRSQLWQREERFPVQVEDKGLPHNEEPTFSSQGHRDEEIENRDKNFKEKLIPKELLKADTDQQNIQSFKTRENNIKNAIFKEVTDHKSPELSLESKATNDHASVSNAESVIDASRDFEDGFEETDAAGIVHGTYISTKNGNKYEIGYKASPELGFVVESSNLEADTAIPIMESSIPDKNEKSFEETDPDGTVHGLFSFKDPEGIVYTVQYEASDEKGFSINNITKQELQEPPQAEERLKKVSPIDNILNKASDKTSKHTKNKITDSLSTSANNRIYSVSADSRSEDKWGEIGETNGVPSSVIIHRPILKRSVQEPDTWKSDKTIDETSVTEDPETKPQTSVTEDPETKPQPNNAYKFGFSVDCQTRNEEADSNGNVRGSYSYIDGDGIETRVKYEAGPEKGFVIKNITYNSIPNNMDQSKTTGTPNNGESQIIDRDYNKVLQKVQRDNLPVNDKNKNIKSMPINFKRENNGFSASGTYSSSEQILQNPLDYKKTPNRGSKRNRDGSFAYSYESPDSYTNQPKNIIHDRKRGNGEYKQLKRTSNRGKTLQRPDVLSSKYQPKDSVYNKNPSFKMENYNNQMYNNINPLNGQTQSYDGIGFLLMNMAYNQQTPQNEKRADQNNILNTANKQQIFKDIKSDREFEIYNMPSDKIPVEAPNYPEVELDPSAIKRAVAMSEIESHKIEQDNNQKQFGIGPLNGAAQENFSRMSPDGSYAFSYTTNDHSRQQSVDSSGNVYSIYQYQSKNDGKNVLVLQTNSLNYPKNSLLGEFKPLPYRSRTQNIQSPIENPTLSYKEPSSFTFNQRRRAESSPIAVTGQRGPSRSNRGGNKKTTHITPGGVLAKYSHNPPLTEKPFRGNTKYNIQAGFY